jgi:tRNA dimethylallyltransferase
VTRKLVVCLMGPTASGKTDMTLKLAEEFPLDVISVDSALVYRGMDIGTAKPDAATLKRVPHRLIDIRNPEDSYSAGEFVRDARAEIDASYERGRIPLLVGGTMMYFRALTEGIAELPGADAHIRAAIDAEAASAGWPAMHAQLAEVDANAAARIEPNDSQRIQRASAESRCRNGRPPPSPVPGTTHISRLRCSLGHGRCCTTGSPYDCNK